MLYEKIRLDENDESAYLEVYAPDKIQNYIRKAILVVPGGGYSNVCSDREGEPIAMAFLPFGYTAFVLHYSVNNKPFPIQLIQASKAMKHIKDNAEKYGIDPEKVFVVGFSAGGHLAGSLGTMWDRKEIYEEVEMEFGYNKPTGMMLIYPVISAKYHGFSFNNLLMKENPTEEELAECSIENNITENSSPAFMLHTSKDSVVYVKNTLCMADKFAELGLEFEMHIFPKGGHGMALANDITAMGSAKNLDSEISKWVQMATAWADRF